MLRKLALVALASAALVPWVGGRRAAAEEVTITCDAYVIAPDGTANPTPVRTGVVGFFTVASVVAPAGVVSGERFVVNVPAETLVLASRVDPTFEVVTQSDFVRVFEVTGASVTDVLAPPEAGATATTRTTFSLGFSSPAPGGSTLTFPNADIGLVADPGARRVSVALIRNENTLELRSADGAITRVRTVCTADPNELSVTAVLGSEFPATGQATRGTIGLAVLLCCLGLAAVTIAGRRPTAVAADRAPLATGDS